MQLYPEMGCNWPVLLMLAILGITDPAVLHFSAIVSSSGDFNSSGSVPAINLALEMLQKQSALPEGYSLAYSMQDSEVSY